jgi:site-specific DNA-methyltransferase (adenine-specific)
MKRRRVLVEHKKKTDTLPQISEEALPSKYFSAGDAAGLITLYHGDCFAGMRSILEPGSVDVIVTSPPYNIGVRYGRYDDGIPREDYLNWIRRWGKLVRRVLAPGGSLFLNIGSKPSDPWIPYDVAGQLREVLELQNVLHWVKSIYIENSSYGRNVSLNVGHFKPINSKRFLNDAHEYIFHFTRSGSVELDRLAIGAPYKDASNITRWKSADRKGRCRGNNWYIPYSTIQRRAVDRPHPASFPPELPEMCIRLHGLSKVKLVLEPFLGIGNTAVACARLGVSMMGFEIDEEYLKTAVAALERKDGFG